MNDFLLWTHGVIAGALGWILKILYSVNTRLTRIEQWIVDKEKEDR